MLINSYSLGFSRFQFSLGLDPHMTSIIVIIPSVLPYLPCLGLPLTVIVSPCCLSMSPTFLEVHSPSFPCAWTFPPHNHLSPIFLPKTQITKHCWLTPLVYTVSRAPPMAPSNILLTTDSGVSVWSKSLMGIVGKTFYHAWLN